MFRPGRTFRITVLATFVALAAVSSAQGAIRYAAPGGTGTDPCASPATPCSIFTAASVVAPETSVQAGDEVILAPGEYTDSGGDLGPGETVQLAPSIWVHGEAGAARPLVRLVKTIAGFGAFIVGEGDTLSHVEVDTATAPTNLSVFEGVLDDAIIRNTSSEGASTIACTQFGGIIRDSVCLASGPNAVAIGESRITAGTSTARLRNVTAVSTGAGGRGLSYAISGSGGVTVNAKAAIAKGAGVDVAAEGLESGGSGGHVAIELDHSDFASVKEFKAGAGASATVTAPETNGTITGEPLLAADGYHQLEGSPTIDTGAVDGFSGSADIDGQSRSIGPPDIGADEWLHPTVVNVSCTPAEVVITDALPGSGTDCKARVSDETTNFLPPTGTVSFTSSSSGEFSPASCALVESASGAESSCEVHYTPKLGSARNQTITATYSGDGAHEGSQGTASITVKEAPLVCRTTKARASGARATASCARPRLRKLTVHLKKKPKKVTTSRRAKFTFSANLKGARFECKLDRARYKRCRSPYKHRVKPGPHVFKVRAVRGKVRSKPARYSWRVVRR
jgi:hypothetical protein